MIDKMGTIDILGKMYDKLSDRSSSITSFALGVSNILWVYLFDRFANGRMNFSKPVSLETWVIVANITLYMLVILLILSVMFGIIGIKKSLSGDRRWMILAVAGILMGILPLIICGYSGRIWFHTLFM